MIPFTENSAKNDQPFLAVVWFHAPQAPVNAADNTIIIFNSDNGPAGVGSGMEQYTEKGNRDLPEFTEEEKEAFLEGGIRFPVLLEWRSGRK